MSKSTTATAIVNAMTSVMRDPNTPAFLRVKAAQIILQAMNKTEGDNSCPGIKITAL